MKKTLGLTLLFITIILTVSAQDKSIFIHSGFNIYSYIGDMGAFDNVGGGFQLGIHFNKKERLNGAFNLGIGQISDDDPTIVPPQNIGSRSPNTYFKTNFFFVNYDLQYNLIKKEQFILFLSQGIGFMRFNPLDDNRESLIEQEFTRAEDEDYRNSAFILPTSLGLTYLFSNQTGLSMKVGLMNTTTDYLDNISEFGDTRGDNVLFTRLSLLIPVNL